MVLGYSAFNTPPGNVAPAFANGNYTATFSNTATFTHGDGETCAAGEYRQNVKGTLSVNGSPLTFYLCGSSGPTLSPTVFQQDGCSPPGCTAYGYRACAAVVGQNQYTPTQATGCNYVMLDVPGFRNVTPGYTYTMAVTFQGLLVNTTTGATLVTRTWTVNGTGVAPASEVVQSSEGLQVDDRVLWVDLTQNLISNAREVHVVIQRSAGLARLNAEGLKVTLNDENGHAVATVGKPDVHEFGDINGSTVSIVYTLASDAPVPKTAMLTKTTPPLVAEQPLILEIKPR